RRICRELPAQDQDRGRCCLRPGRQDHRCHHDRRENRSDRRRQDLRHQSRPCGSHPHRRGRCCGPLISRSIKIQSGVNEMTFKRPYGAGLAALAVGMLAATAAYAEPTVNKGDNAWMLTSTVLVLMMSIPGLALFYGGLVRSKNMLSVLMQVFVTFSMITVLWVLYGYSLAFTEGNQFVGGLSRVFLNGVFDPVKGDFSTAATFSKGVVIPEIVFVVFQATFAAITCCLIVGAFAERIKFSAVLLFMALWFTFSYAPIAHMVWFWMGPDAYTGKEVVDAVNAKAGLAWQWGALDFAGGTVVHINAAVAGLVGAYMIGKRVG